MTKINDRWSARNITTYDFSTLYTNFSLDDIKIAIKSVVKLAFKHSKKKYISIYKNGYSWSDNPRSSTSTFSEASLVDNLIWLLDNSYFHVGDAIYKQLIGVPIGVDCGPFVANLTLFYYENKFLESLYKQDYKSAHKLNGTFRLIDDISSINSDGHFERLYPKIYPESLVLNKENCGNLTANVLDLGICVENNKFDVGIR